MPGSLLGIALYASNSKRAMSFRESYMCQEPPHLEMVCTDPTLTSSPACSFPK